MYEMPGQDNKIVNYETMGKGLRRRIIPSSGHGPFCVCVCVGLPSDWLVSIRMRMSFLLGFALLMSFQLLYNEIFQWDLPVSQGISQNANSLQFGLTLDYAATFFWPPLRSLQSGQVINGLYTHTQVYLWLYRTTSLKPHRTGDKAF